MAGDDVDEATYRYIGQLENEIDKNDKLICLLTQEIKDLHEIIRDMVDRALDDRTSG